MKSDVGSKCGGRGGLAKFMMRAAVVLPICFFDIGRENTTTTQGASEANKPAAAPAKAKAPLKASGKGVNKPTPEGVVKSVAPATPVS